VVAEDGDVTGARSEILSAARRLFATKGYRATSVQDLADELGYGKASLYHYLHSKDDLLYAIHELFMRRLIDEMRAILERDSPPAEKLRDVIVSFVELVSRYPEEATIVNDEMRQLAPRNYKRVVTRRDEYERLLTELVEDGVKRGEFHAADAHVAVRAILGMTNWCYRWLSPNGPLSATDVGGQMATLILRGLGQRDPGRRSS
jgi:AcrR family transcriptional regulator